MLGIALCVAACALAVAYGSNAGSTIVSIGLTVGSIKVWAAVLVVGSAVAVAPAVVGTAVATTVAEELVTLDGDAGKLALLCAVVSALLVTATLSGIGLPTSLTVALLGGLAGVGVGAELPVSWGRLTAVFATIAITPLLGGILAYAIRLLMSRAYFHRGLQSAVAAAHIVAFALLAFAFGANDGQKILAVLSVAFDTPDGGVRAVWWQLLTGACLFAFGAALGLRRMARGVNSGVLPVRPLDAVIVESSTSIVMLASSAFGSPAGMAQTLSGSLIGSGLIAGTRRIRWPFAARIVNAWVVTLPATLALGLLLGWLTKALFEGYEA